MSKPTLRQIEVGERTLDLEDAKVPFKYILTRNHIWGSESKAKKPLSHCVRENSILDMPGVLDCKCYKTVSYIIFKGNPHKAMRYIPSRDGDKVAKINDKYGKKQLLKLLVNPMELWEESPRFNRSLEYIRSPEMQRIRKESNERRRGKTKRAYTSPTKKGFRNGTGYGKAHMWKAL